MNCPLCFKEMKNKYFCNESILEYRCDKLFGGQKEFSEFWTQFDMYNNTVILGCYIYYDEEYYLNIFTNTICISNIKDDKNYLLEINRNEISEEYLNKLDLRNLLIKLLNLKTFL
jgi:hypothetical protein